VIPRGSILGFLILLIGSAVSPAPAQKLDPVHWSLSAEPARVAPGSRYQAR